MAEVFANTDDGYQGSALSATWNDSHDHVGLFNPITTRKDYGYSAEAVYYNPPRDKFVTRRYFAAFDTSGITSTLSEATLKLYINNASYDNGDCIVLKSGHDNTNTSEDWFGTWLTGLGGSLSGWTASSSGVTAYSAEAEMIGAGVGYFDIPLNAAALSDMVSLSTFKIVVMNYDHDYLDVAPIQGESNNSGWFHADKAGTSVDPKIDYTVSTGYGNDVSGIDSGDISTISGIATANISKISGV